MNDLTVHQDQSITLGNDRQMVCLEVVWEIDAIARALPSLVPESDHTLQLHLVMRALASRMIALTEVMTGCLMEPGTTTKELKSVVLVAAS